MDVSSITRFGNHPLTAGRWLALAIALLCLADPPPALAQSGSIGTAEFVHGAVSARQAGRDLRLLEKGSPLYGDDTIVTARSSFVIVKLRDKTAFTVRPDSVLRIDRYSDAAGTEAATFSLLKGGLRAITGLIGKRRPDAYRISTPVATIGVRGTEFDARLCAKDCAEEEKKGKPVNPPVRSAVVARVVVANGVLTARDAAGTARTVVVGGPLYEGDTLVTGKGAHGVIAFRDDSRVSIQPDSELVIQDYGYDRGDAKQDSFAMNLVRGGLRALTGEVGKRSPEQFKVKTPTSTIGVRGTGFDVFYRNPTWVSTWLGTIVFQLPSGGALAVSQGQTIYLSAPGAEPVYLDSIPAFMQNLPAANPGEVEVDPDTFSGIDLKEIVPGLYLRVKDGHVVLDQNGNILHFGRDEAGLANGDGLVRLEVIPNFLLNDDVPAPGTDPKLIELLGLLSNDFSSSEFMCEVR